MIAMTILYFAFLYSFFTLMQQKLSKWMRLVAAVVHGLTLSYLSVWVGFSAVRRMMTKPDGTVEWNELALSLVLFGCIFFHFILAVWLYHRNARLMA
jgi:hypothetical protein